MTTRPKQPTEKRLHDAVERGQTAFSREAPLFASLSATLIALVFVDSGPGEDLCSAPSSELSTTPLAGGSNAELTFSCLAAASPPPRSPSCGRSWRF